MTNETVLVDMHEQIELKINVHGVYQKSQQILQWSIIPEKKITFSTPKDTRLIQRLKTLIL